MGVNCNKYLHIDINVKEAADKLKGTFLSLVNCGLLNSNGLHPLSCKKIYNSVVLPKSLYGCESWFCLTASQILILERAHRFCVKFMQGLNIRTRTDAALSLLGIYSIESEIDFKKLILFGQFCRNDLNCWVQSCFYKRIASFVVYRDLQEGYIPDIINILEKYELKNYFDDYIKNNNFPSKSSWKRLVRCRIQEKEVSAWLNRTSAPEFDRFRRLHTDYSPHNLWISSKENLHVLSQSISCIQMTARTADNVLSPLSCLRCNCNYNNIVDHCIHDCSFVAQERLNLWYEIFHLNTDIFSYLRSLDKTFLTLIFLGLEVDRVHSSLGSLYQMFRFLCPSNLHQMWSKSTQKRSA